MSMNSFQKNWLPLCWSWCDWPKRLEFSLKKVSSWLLILVLFSGSLGVPAHPQAPDEYQVKAAFLYNFARFTAWPADSFNTTTAPFVVGILGEDPFGNRLEQSLNGKSIDGHFLTIKRLKWGQNLRECHLLFICPSERKRLAQILESLKGFGILTVSELNNFCQQGGMINFVLENNKVWFVINQSVAEQARLKISSKLLNLAKPVPGERQLGRN